jgi:LysR family transcriptional regulator, glycine cleavage system transcriptional activator
MADRLPPLTALRAFEAAARHMSFARAASELNVTPAALSYQIKVLEADLGQPVFRRMNRAVELTAAGRALVPGVADAFAGLSAAWRSTKRLNDTGVLTVTAGPAFTSKWLAPRMYDFAQAHKDVELRFLATLRVIDFDRDDVDVAIRFGLGHDKAVYSRPLIHEWMTPMMVPSLAETIRSPDDLAGAVLIHDDSIGFFRNPADWAAWCQAAGIRIDTSHGPRFSQADHALDAAIAGAGVVLGRVSLATRALESGRLVAPFQIGLVAEAQFRFICPLGHEKRPHVAAFEAWVLSEIQSSRRFEEGRIMVQASDLA